MDPARQPIQAVKPNEELRKQILQIVDANNGAFWGEFHDELVPSNSEEDVLLALRSLVHDGTLRMKEDDSEHDWEYRRA